LRLGSILGTVGGASLSSVVLRQQAMHEFEQSFLARPTNRRGLTLFKPADALSFIAGARAHGVRVLGVETFVVTESTTEPQMDHILDLSGADTKCDTWIEAEQFISERGAHGYLFEVTV
jgi:hypothetical protein